MKNTKPLRVILGVALISVVLFVCFFISMKRTSVEITVDGSTYTMKNHDGTIIAKGNIDISDDGGDLIISIPNARF